MFNFFQVKYNKVIGNYADSTVHMLGLKNNEIFFDLILILVLVLVRSLKK